jgi:hypothetical protein
MNWRLLIQVISFQVVEFSLFWLIAGWIPLPLSHLTKFFILLAFDVGITELVFPGTFGWLISEIFSNEKE